MENTLLKEQAEFLSNLAGVVDGMQQLFTAMGGKFIDMRWLIDDLRDAEADCRYEAE